MGLRSRSQPSFGKPPPCASPSSDSSAVFGDYSDSLLLEEAIISTPSSYLIIRELYFTQSCLLRSRIQRVVGEKKNKIIRQKRY